MPPGNLAAMTEPVPAEPDPEVLVPAGATLVDAATWIGSACWAELRLHEVLTGWLAVEADPATAATWWALRAHRAELAAAWHRRLPELRELPRAGFVEPATPGTGGPTAGEGLAALEGLQDPDATAARRSALADVLASLADHYLGHLAVAAGPADGPTVDTLALALARTEADVATLRDQAWATSGPAQVFLRRT